MSVCEHVHQDSLIVCALLVCEGNYLYVWVEVVFFSEAVFTLKATYIHKESKGRCDLQIFKLADAQHEVLPESAVTRAYVIVVDPQNYFRSQSIHGACCWHSLVFVKSTNAALSWAHDVLSYIKVNMFTFFLSLLLFLVLIEDIESLPLLWQLHIVQDKHWAVSIIYLWNYLRSNCN